MQYKVSKNGMIQLISHEKKDCLNDIWLLHSAFKFHKNFICVSEKYNIEWHSSRETCQNRGSITLYNQQHFKSVSSNYQTGSIIETQSNCRVKNVENPPASNAV